jgi:hypothetical protein
MWSPYGLKKLGIENARPFFTRGVMFDGQGMKGRVLDVGEEIALADLKACLERQGVDEQTIAPRFSCAPAMDRAGIWKPAPCMKARRASVSNARAGSRA